MPVKPKANSVQVVRFQDRHILKNGYHRTFQLMRSGEEYVPALVREVSSYGETGGAKPGFFSPQIVLADRPPVMPDYMSRAAVTMESAATNTVIEVTATKKQIPGSFRGLAPAGADSIAFRGCNRRALPSLYAHHSPVWRDSNEYAFERDSEDLAAVVESIDYPVFLLGHSTGRSVRWKRPCPGNRFKSILNYKAKVEGVDEVHSVRERACLAALPDRINDVCLLYPCVLPRNKD